MKIILTGGGTGGHFYPLIAVAEEVRRIESERKLARIEMRYFSDVPYDEEALMEQGISFTQIPAGKLRVYFSIQNFFDIFKTGWGALIAFWKVLMYAPDVIFAKGAYASFPTLLAGRLLGIPVIIHESDAAPGRVTSWAGKFAEYIAVSYPDAASFFPKERVAHTGQPVRGAISHPESIGAYEYLGFSRDIPIVWIVGGSSGAQIINDVILEALPTLVGDYQVIHQTGKANFEAVTQTAEVILKDNPFKSRYKPIAYLNPLALRMCAGASALVISRAGSFIFEIAAWALPSIIVPFKKSNNDHARKNAYAYARAGACVVIEESNLSPNLLVSEIARILAHAEIKLQMKSSARQFALNDAAQVIARKMIEIGLSHEEDS
jgi:UDP-N-acetylglucosamine--N-acetylmuramyl-(pentapeptide) pyrophosphoryl-undecaprenol N-acetylglucosamine transferase